MRLNLKVKYEEKDLAKAKGARWDSDNKTWYLDFNNEKEILERINDFRQWINNDTNCLVCGPIYIFENLQTCWKCQKENKTLLMGTTNYVDLENEYYSNSLTFLLHNKYIYNDKLVAFLKTQYNYELRYTKTTNDTHYQNCCHHCNSVLGDGVIFQDNYKDICKASFFDELINLNIHNKKDNLKADIKYKLIFPNITELLSFNYHGINPEVVPGVDLDYEKKFEEIEY